MAQIHTWATLTSQQLRSFAGEGTVAILPVGAIEQHGPHLPLGTDTLIAEGLVATALERSSDDLTALVLPTQAIGESTEHTSFAGTLGHEAETLLAAWTEIGVALCRNGVRKLVIVNAHGGQPQIVDLVAQRLRARHAMLVVRANYMSWPLPPGLIDDDERSHGHHGGLAETAIMLALHPDLVVMDHAADFPSKARDLAGKHRRFGHGGSLGFAWQAEDLNNDGVVGNAAKATAELGHALLVHHAARLADMIADAAAFDRKGHFQRGS
ncbi:MAG: creatininase [Rhodospirillaceae bacterium]|nr:creatininase [Rhodospirillaceae bacterium]|tara:strand:+ start:4864 stop:5667 length:804 start_codon:yes stop_codon:yes gene_type:complete